MKLKLKYFQKNKIKFKIATKIYSLLVDVKKSKFSLNFIRNFVLNFLY